MSQSRKFFLGITDRGLDRLQAQATFHLRGTTEATLGAGGGTGIGGEDGEALDGRIQENPGRAEVDDFELFQVVVGRFWKFQALFRGHGLTRLFLWLAGTRH